ncbi:hypothetical protein E2C01_047804 [Portunus trituberculatus]|uniref:Uncharacterized protein n=1 Tax=Portunus trituberculatus TaxID=210409 RepID=A0A5B7G211_PORTR|nr:hypothetical protein [Portunus trituberculatus]
MGAMDCDRLAIPMAYLGPANRLLQHGSGALLLGCTGFLARQRRACARPQRAALAMLLATRYCFSNYWLSPGGSKHVSPSLSQGCDSDLDLDTTGDSGSLLTRAFESAAPVDDKRKAHRKKGKTRRSKRKQGPLV